FFAGYCAASHSQNSIFAVEIDRDFFRQIVRDEIGNSPAEIHEAAIPQLARSTLGDLLSRQSRMSRCDSFLNAVIRHHGALPLARGDEQRSPGSSHVPH